MTGILIIALVTLLTIHILLVAKTRHAAKKAAELANAEREYAAYKAKKAQEEEDRKTAQAYIDNLKKDQANIIVENGVLRRKPSKQKSVNTDLEKVHDKRKKKSSKKKPSKKKK